MGRAGWGMQCRELDARAETYSIVAGCDTYVPWRDRFAERYPQARVYTDLADLLADPEIDLVSIATFSCDHAAHAQAALQAGRNVLLEKPMCHTYEEAQALQSIAEQGPARLFVRHNRRFEAGFQTVRSIISSGQLGQIAVIKLSRVSFGRRNDWQTLTRFGGGQLGNWGSHIIDHGLQFLGAPTQPLQDVQTHLRRIAAVGDAEDHAKIVLTGHDGAIVDIEISGGAALPAPEYLVWGTRGALEVKGDTLRLKYLDPAVPLPPRTAHDGIPDAQFVLPDGTQTLANRTIGSNFGQAEVLPWLEEERKIPDADPGLIWDALYQTLHGGAPFPVQLPEAVEVMRVVDIARKQRLNQNATLA